MGRVSAADEIYPLTGTNETVDFNIPQEVLSAKWRNVPTIHMQTGKISGDFYIKWVGFVAIPEAQFAPMWKCTDFADDCKKYIQKASNTAIWDVTILYNFSKKIGKINGTIQSANYWNIELWEISAENPNTHLELANLKASNTAQIEIKNSKPNHIYTLNIFDNNQLFGSATNEWNFFKNLDLSLSGEYDFVLIDSENGTKISETKLDNIKVAPWEINTSIETSDFQAKKYCQENPTSTDCPDGKDRLPSQIVQEKNIFPWERTSIIIKLRDKYGNRISGESIQIEIKNTLQSNELLPNPSDITAEFFPTSQFTGNTGTIPWFSNSDYSFAAEVFVPSKWWKLQIDAKKFGVEDISSKNIFTNIITNEPFSLEKNEIPDKIYSQLTGTAKISIKKNITWTLSPKIITKIAGNWNFSDVTVIGTFYCEKKFFDTFPTNPFCKNYSPTEVVVASENTSSEIKITPKITTNKEILALENFIGYTIDWKNYIYKVGDTKNISVEQPTPKDIELAGGITSVSNADSLKESIASKSARNSLLNTIRKNIAYLGRNITDFSRKNYQIERSADMHITSIGNKRAIIAVGKDIYIKTDISENSQGPIAIIALSQNGQGGNIHINGNVKNIHAALIAEKSILGDSSNKKNQLYIKWSVFADNICNNDEQTCFLKIRNDFDFTKAETVAVSNNPNKIILEYDNRILTNPPPALENFVE